jgi:hypothetical protein
VTHGNLRYTDALIRDMMNFAATYTTADTTETGMAKSKSDSRSKSKQNEKRAAKRKR